MEIMLLNLVQNVPRDMVQVGAMAIANGKIQIAFLKVIQNRQTD